MQIVNRDFWLGSLIRLGGAVFSEPTRRAGTRVRILAEARIFILKLTTKELPDGYSENQVFIIFRISRFSNFESRGTF